MNEHDRFEGTASRSALGSEPTVSEECGGGKLCQKAAVRANTCAAKTLDKLSETFTVLDCEGRILRWTKALNELTGLSDNQLVSRKFDDLFPQQESDRVREAVQSVREQGTAILETLVRGKDASLRRYEITAELLRDRAGTFSSICVRGRDVIRRESAKEELAEKEEQYRHLTEESLTGIYIHQDGVFAYVNQRMAEMLGYSVEEMIGKPFWEFIHPEDRGLVRQRGLDRSQGKPAIPHYEFRGLCKNGETRWQELLAATITFRGRTANMGNVADITERKRSEQENRKLNDELERRVAERTAELEDVNRELKDFAYVISHDLRAPLRSINQLATWIRDDYAECFDDDGKEQISLLLGRVKRMENLIEGVLKYSRIGRIKEGRQEIDSNDLVYEAIDLVAPPANIRVVVENKLPLLTGEPTLLLQVFQNLIDNAVKFMDKPEGEIRIGCSEESGYWRFSVSDNGPGIDERYHDRIFQIFQTLAPRDRVESTGIGLTLVKKIVELSGGSVRVASQVGIGTTFHVTVPKGSIL